MVIICSPKDVPNIDPVAKAKYDEYTSMLKNIEYLESNDGKESEKFKIDYLFVSTMDALNPGYAQLDASSKKPQCIKAQNDIRTKSDSDTARYIQMTTKSTIKQPTIDARRIDNSRRRRRIAQKLANEYKQLNPIARSVEYNKFIKDNDIDEQIALLKTRPVKNQNAQDKSRIIKYDEDMKANAEDDLMIKAYNEGIPYYTLAANTNKELIKRKEEATAFINDYNNKNGNEKFNTKMKSSNINEFIEKDISRYIDNNKIIDAFLQYTNNVASVKRETIGMKTAEVLKVGLANRTKDNVDEHDESDAESEDSDFGQEVSGGIEKQSSLLRIASYILYVILILYLIYTLYCVYKRRRIRYNNVKLNNDFNLYNFNYI
jgi:hypothetical protein